VRLEGEANTQLTFDFYFFGTAFTFTGTWDAPPFIFMDDNNNGSRNDSLRTIPEVATRNQYTAKDLSWRFHDASAVTQGGADSFTSMTFTTGMKTQAYV
jgi:hypothetical protein